MKVFLALFVVCLTTGSALAQQQKPLCPPTCRDRYCEAIRQKLLSINQCFQDAATSTLESRTSDAGYFYCTRRQQYHETPVQALQGFERLRPPRNDTESMLDRFAVETATQILCP
jgi:hypothetical protein